MPLLIPSKFINSTLKTPPLKKPIFLLKLSSKSKVPIMALMKTVFLVVHMILHFLWNEKVVNHTYDVDFQPWNSFVPKWIGNGTMWHKNQNVYATVIILAQLHPVVEWFISTLNRTFVLIPDVSVIPMNGIPLTKYA